VIATIHGGVDRHFIGLSIAVAILVTIRHRQNIRNLLRGDENKA